MSEHPDLIKNEDGTITFFVNKLGTPSKIDGRIYSASEEVIDKFTKNSIGKIVGTFGNPDMTGLTNIADILKRLEEKDPFNSVGIMVDLDLKAKNPYLVVDPSKRLKQMVENEVPFQMGLRAIVEAHNPDSGKPLTVLKIISYDAVTR